MFEPFLIGVEYGSLTNQLIIYAMLFSFGFTIAILPVIVTTIGTVQIYKKLRQLKCPPPTQSPKENAVDCPKEYSPWHAPPNMSNMRPV